MSKITYGVFYWLFCALIGMLLGWALVDNVSAQRAWPTSKVQWEYASYSFSPGLQIWQTRKKEILTFDPKKFYKQIGIPVQSGNNLKVANKAGADGWELIAYSANEMSVDMWFKRLKR